MVIYTHIYIYIYLSSFAAGATEFGWLFPQKKPAQEKLAEHRPRARAETPPVMTYEDSWDRGMLRYDLSISILFSCTTTHVK